MFRRIFDKKIQDGEITLQNEGARNIYEQPFPNHNNNKNKGHAIMVSASDELPMQAEDEPDLKKMAQWVQNLFKVKHFYDHMDCNP